MTKALAVEFAPYEINVNCVVPTGNSPAFERTKMERADQRVVGQNRWKDT